MVNFFKKLYSKEDGACVMHGIEWSLIEKAIAFMLKQLFEEKEVRQAVMSCEGDKAPGIDGFSLALFQKGWGAIKQDLMEVFGEFFRNGVVNTCTNRTLIALVPKRERPGRLGEFISICLVTYLYKVLAKVLATRLSSVVGSTVAENQGAFIQGRKLLDMTLIAN